MSALLAVLVASSLAQGGRAVAPRLRVVVDAGHGAPNNTGNHGCFCQSEADFTLDAARELTARLKTMGFDVVMTRDLDTPTYQARIRAIEELHADAVVSLHSDWRVWAWQWQPFGDFRACERNDWAPGFSVLWSEEGPEALLHSRALLARSVAHRMSEAGFDAYGGAAYGTKYRADFEPGVFIDAHPARERVYFLKASVKVPIIIVETHHALDIEETKRWREATTMNAFAAAVAAALRDFTARR